MKNLEELLKKTHLEVPFNSTVFTLDKVIRNNPIGGDCIDQVIYMSDQLDETGLMHRIITFSDEHNKYYHAGIIVNDKYYLDPAMGLTVPLLINGKKEELVIEGFATILFSFKYIDNLYQLIIESPTGISNKTTNEITTKKNLIEFQRSKSLERLSIMWPVIPGKNDQFIKIKQDSRGYWYILDGKSVQSSGKLPSKILKEYAHRANLSEKKVIKAWNNAIEAIL